MENFKECKISTNKNKVELYVNTKNDYFCIKL